MVGGGAPQVVRRLARLGEDGFHSSNQILKDKRKSDR
ncbi:MAG: hypothetical protein CM1200mP15_22550 [Dehalococcoidia bacterium]|nr:MAG: hypothetical protein CM1200mP15_22550 [Dehalococcoidia bacterium]